LESQERVKTVKEKRFPWGRKKRDVHAKLYRRGKKGYWEKKKGETLTKK